MITMTETGEGLLRGILDNPEDDARRLVYADWLEEQGDAVRAEFIRVQLRLAEYERDPQRPTNPMQRLGWLIARCQEQRILNAVFGNGRACDCERCLTKLAEELLRAHGIRLSAPTAELLGGPVGICSTVMASLTGRWSVSFCRGFVESVICTSQAWLAHAGAILARHPVQRVTLTDKLPVRHQGSQYWQWDGTDTAEESCLPSVLFHLLDGWKMPVSGGFIAPFDSEQMALDALLNACLTYGRAARQEVSQ